jgi:hypothetical protein
MLCAEGTFRGKEIMANEHSATGSALAHPWEETTIPRA